MTTRGRSNPKIATAGWAIPRAVSEQFAAEGSGLARYAGHFGAVEINSTFYRRHRPSTYSRWAADTPTDFRFAIKLPRAITHEARLVGVSTLLMAFRAEMQPLETKLGPLLVQLPPSLAFDETTAESFFNEVRDLWPTPVVCEPRHVSWFEHEAEAFLRGARVARAAADPARHPTAFRPGGWAGLSYWRLHGSPRMYYSSYPDAALLSLASEVKSRPGEDWCVFDNTASGAAAGDALRLKALLSGERESVA